MLQFGIIQNKSEIEGILQSLTLPDDSKLESTNSKNIPPNLINVSDGADQVENDNSINAVLSNVGLIAN